MGNAFKKISYGLFVVTTALEGYDNGCITNTVMQVTTTPNRISVAVNKNNYTHDLMLKSGIFNVSVISESANFELFRHFGFQSGRDVDKFENFSDFSRSSNGLTYITKGTNAFISAKIISTVDLGTHTMFIADVVEDGDIDQTPSATYSYYFANIKPKPQKATQTLWRCTICGYEEKTNELAEDFTCPWCKHPKSDFVKVEI